MDNNKTHLCKSISDSLENISLIVKDNNIPYFSVARPLLYNIFAIETGPACLLITHYYISGKSASDTGPFLYDMADQSRWCTQNLVYFSKLSKRFKQVRNKLVHRALLTFSLFKATVEEIILFTNKPSKVGFLVNGLLDQISEVCNVILTGKLNECAKICPLCRTDLSNRLNGNDTINNGDEPIMTIDHADKNSDPNILSNTVNNDDVINSLYVTTNSKYSNEIKNTVLMYDKSEIEFTDEFLLNPCTLRRLKDAGYRDKLKGSKIKILQGKNSGIDALFRSWAGTVAYVEIQGVGRKCLSMDTLVQVMQ